jgi:hypothetical protein
MKAAAATFVALGLLALPALSKVPGVEHGTVSDVADAITELDVDRARAILASIDIEGAALALERARLGLYTGDCDAASATLATLAGVKDAAPLADLAKNCARATAGSLVIDDTARGLWIRLQDESDAALVPLLSDVAVRARAAIERDLGVTMPRPLRIDLVRDLFSLSAVSGLPLTAAETTGTVAVARWGRVNMISPRAAPGGFPWQDTLAHEITHLALSRATRDQAPLWLQEGIAKRQEIRWRPPRPFDGDPPPDTIARDALLSGESVGVDKIGPSIAMLPSADAASIAFAEVSSFIEYWIEQNGRAALMLLFADLKGLGGPRATDAMLSVTGYDFETWIARWQDHLRRLPSSAPGAGNGGGAPHGAEAEQLQSLLAEGMPVDARNRARKLRIGELLFSRGAPALSAERFRGVFASDPEDPVVRWRLGRSLIAQGAEDKSAPLFESSEGLAGPSAGWFALQGRERQHAQSAQPAQASVRDSFDLAVALDPYLEDAACEGVFRVPDAAGQLTDATLPALPERRVLCESARKIHGE